MTRDDKSIDRSRHAQGAPRTRGISVSVRSIRPVLGYLAANRHDTAEALRAADIDAACVADPEGRVPHRAAIALWEAAGQMTQDPDLGLHVGEGIRPGAFGALDYAVRTSATLGAGYARLFRYHRVLHDTVEAALEIDGRYAVLSHRLPLPGGAPRPVSESILCAWMIGGRQATGVDWAPRQVRFPHAEPADTSEHRRLFRAPLRFGHTRSELVLDRQLLDLPMVQADAALQTIVEAQVQALHERVALPDSTADSVRSILGRWLCDGEPRLETLARELHMSPRTLNRRLQDEGTGFQHILAEVRRELAERHLREGRLAIGEITFLLGFSEASAFHRAFKRWTGVTPAAYRSAGIPSPGVA